MSLFAEYRVQPIDEEVVDRIVMAAGGRRAHDEADRRSEKGADYIIGSSVIELKSLDDEGLSKPERQAKIADLFRKIEPERPVIVIDRDRLEPQGQRIYDRAIEGPLKTAVAKARRQLRQSRQEFPETDRSILVVINNGNSALDQDEIKRLVARRARQDTEEIDGVVVAGCYQHTDGFDTIFLWPCEYVPIRADRPFREYDAFLGAFQAYAQEHMTALMRGQVPARASKGAVLDTRFELNGIRFVKPAPRLGRESDFFINGRPRLNPATWEDCPTVGITFPDMTREEWARFKKEIPYEYALRENYEEWLKSRELAISEGTPLKPLVPISVTVDAWRSWLAGHNPDDPMATVKTFANEVFDSRAKALVTAARERDTLTVIPSRYVLIVTELIGQDETNDVTRIAIVREHLNGETEVRQLVPDTRLRFLHGVALAASHATNLGVDAVLWRKVKTYAWI